MRVSSRLRSASIFASGLITLLSAAPAAAATNDPEQAEDAIRVDAGESWASSIDPEALETYLRPTDRSILVIGVGEGGPKLEDAVESLETQFRAVPRKLKVVGASWSGNPETDDQRIVAKAAGTSFSPDVALVARMFDDELIVTLYDAEGEVIDGFITTRGQPLAPRAERSEGGGVKEQALDAVGDIAEEHTGASAGTRHAGDPELEEAYQSQRLNFQRQGVFNPYTGTVGYVEGDKVTVGLHGRTMNYAQALRHMGREELADDYERRHGRRTAMIVVGAITAVGLPAGGGMLFVATDLGSSVDELAWRTGGGVALGVGIVGGITLITGIAMGEAVNKDDMRRYMGEYNTDLRRRLRSSEAEEMSLGRSIRETWSLAPAVSRQGASLSFSARF